MTKVYNEILGREVEVPDKPKRIVSFSPAITESLFMLGFGDSIIGVTAFCARPPEARNKRKIGSYNTVSIELLNELKPEIIFTVTGYQREFAKRLSNFFQVYPFELPVSVTGIIDTIIKLGLVLGVPEKARTIAHKLLRELSIVNKAPKRLQAYIEIDLGGPVSFGAYSYITDAIHFLGCSTIYDNYRAEWLTPDFEYVRKVEPDVLIYEAKMYSKFGIDDLVKLVEERGWSNMSFVKRGNYFITPGPLDFLAHHGPSFISEVMPWLQSRLYVASARI